MAQSSYPGAPAGAQDASNMTALLGQGAYTFTPPDDTEAPAAAGSQYGQSITEDQVNNIVYGGINGMIPTDDEPTVSSLLGTFRNMVHTLDLSLLKLMKPFIPHATDDDFVDQPTASDTVWGAFHVKWLVGGGSDGGFAQWMSDLFGNLKTKFSQISGVFHGDVITAIDTEVQNIKDWHDQLESDRAAKYAVAKQNWDDYLTNRGILHAADSGTREALNDAWQTRKDNNDEIIRDYFHQTYPKGTTSDDATTLVGGLPTWWGAVNDNKLIRKERLGLATLPTTIQAEIGDSVTLNAATAASAAAAASLSQAVTQDLMNQGVGAQTGVVPALATSADFYTAYQNIPESNVGGASGSTVAYGATGAGGTGSANNNASASWTHLPESTDTALYAVVATSYPAPTGNNGTSVSAGGNNMTLVQTQTTVAGFGACILLETWRIALTPSASPSAISIVAHVSASGAIKIWGQSFSYFGQKVARVTSGSGTFTSGGNSQSITVPAPSTGHTLLGVGMMYLATSSGSFTGPAIYFTTSGGTASGTSRWNNGGPTNQVYAAQAESTSASTGKLAMGVTAPSGTSGSNWLAQALELSN